MIENKTVYLSIRARKLKFTSNIDPRYLINKTNSRKTIYKYTDFLDFGKMLDKFFSLEH